MTNNAILVCAVAFLAVAYAGVIDHHKMDSIHAECQANPATKIDESALKSGHDVDNIGPHTLCMITKAGLLTPGGDVNKEVLKEHVTKHSHDPSKVDEIMNDCGKRVGATAVEAAVALGNCLRKYEGPSSHDTHDHHHHHHH